MKDDSGIIAKQLLVFSVTVDYLARRWIYHSRYIVYESKHESSLAARRRSGNYGCKRMSKRQHVVVVVSRSSFVLFIPFPPPPPLPQGACTSFSKKHCHQGENCTYHHHDYYPKRLVFVYHTVSNDRQYGAIFHCVMFERVCVCVRALFILIHNTMGMVICFFQSPSP